ncbi:MAG TPA: class I SAM-dependent methyltransferase [Symbiobacteriaceae bacterium]|jgi:ubiquinone/menaquinone biosynthesis C-methylase UbiE
MIDVRKTESIRRKYNRNALVYDAMDQMVRDDWRLRVIGQARGRVLELGVGTGKNLGLYDPAVTAELVGIDFSPAMLARARSKPCRVPLTLLEMDAQQLTFPDHSFDTVLATCVFCTVPDPVLGLREARRVCKPDGRVLLLEHVRLDRPVLGRLMDLLDPLSVAVIGTHINRRTVENARLAGLTIERVEPVRGDLVKLILARP